MYEQGYFKKGNSDILSQIKQTRALVNSLIEQVHLTEQVLQVQQEQIARHHRKVPLMVASSTNEHNAQLAESAENARTLLKSLGEGV
jgi:hypothetical protein